MAELLCYGVIGIAFIFAVKSMLPLFKNDEVG